MNVKAKALRDSLPVMTGYLTMGFAAGVLLAVKGGLPCAPLWAALTSATCVSGTLQFVIVKPLAEGATLWSVILLTLAINFRYALYGFSMLTRWRGVPWWKKLFLIHMLTDETYALEMAQPEEPKSEYLKYCICLSMLNMSYWITGVTTGALVGTAFTLPSKGIEFAMAALFIVVLTDQIREWKGGHAT